MSIGVNVADESGRSSVDIAVGSFESAALGNLKLLLGAGAYPDFADDKGKRPIETAIEGNDVSFPLVGLLLQQMGPDKSPTVNLTAKNPKSGNSLLHHAAWCGNADAMIALLGTGAFADMLEERNDTGQTALHIAAFRSPKAVCEALVNAGANPKAVEKNGRRLSKETPLMMAESMGRKDNADFFVSMGGAMNAMKFSSKMAALKGKA